MIWGLAHLGKKVEGLTAMGPIHVNVLRLQQPLLMTLDCRVKGNGMPLEQLTAQEQALAAVSGRILSTQSQIFKRRATAPIPWVF